MQPLHFIELLDGEYGCPLIFVHDSDVQVE